MAKKKQQQFVCTECGEQHSKWSGKCDSCGAWSTLVEFFESSMPKNPKSGQGSELKFKSVQELASSKSKNKDRIKTGISDVDEVLGGGIVAASVNLISGEPGIGKSTLIMQIASAVANSDSGSDSKNQVLYVSGEESAEQVASRASRLNLLDSSSSKDSETLGIVSSTSTDDIAATILKLKPTLAIIDSIQTMACSEVNSATGSVSQVTNSTHILTQAAKSAGTALFIVGHVTKEGSLAGPKMLEHLVDVVLNLEGDRYGGFKILRAIKNRYGSTSEAGIFNMTDKGLEQVQNPSESLLAERQVTDGSIVFAAMEGTRPLLVEVQALVNRTNFGYPKRASSGFDLNRLNLLVAVLTRRTKLNLNDFDIYINVVGGIKLAEPAADLAVAMAIASAAKGLSLNQDLAVAGELGLSGEIRRIPNLPKREAEAKKLGFKGLLAPKPDSKSNFIQEAKSLREVLNTWFTVK
jgi:DNA repair protein RadA/Sms